MIFLLCEIKIEIDCDITLRIGVKILELNLKKIIDFIERHEIGNRIIMIYVYFSVVGTYGMLINIILVFY